MLPIAMLMMLIISSNAANHNNWAEPKCGHSMLSNYIFGYLQPRISSMLKWIQIWICHTGWIIIIIIILVCHANESKVVCHAYEFKVAMTWPLTMSLSGPLRASKRLNCYSTYQASFIIIALYLLCGRLTSNFHSSVLEASKVQHQIQNVVLPMYLIWWILSRPKGCDKICHMF